MKPIVVAPSILAADVQRLGEDVHAVDQAGANWIHIDVMDGKFVPNISFGPAIVDAVRRPTAKPLNVHLMIVKPERYLGDFAQSGADHVLVQARPSSTAHLHRVLSHIRELKKVGAVLGPVSPIGFVEQAPHLCDVVLVMAVNPRFGGRNFCRRCCRKSEICAGSASRRGSTRGSRSMAHRTAKVPHWPSRWARTGLSPDQQYSIQATTQRPSPEFETAHHDIRMMCDDGRCIG